MATRSAVGSWGATGLVELNCQRVATAFAGAVTTRVIDERAPHQPCRETKKMGTILPRNALPVDQPQVHLVDKGGGLKRVPRPLSPHVAPGKPTLSGIDERDQLLESRLVTSAQGAKKTGD